MIYLKDLHGFWASEHHPLLCWSGAGYRFRDVRTASVHGVPVMRGVLEHDGRRYSTAWWYSAGGGHDYSGPGWRWDALRSRRGYSIVNVTAPDDAVLEREIGELRAEPALERWLRRAGR